MLWIVKIGIPDFNEDNLQGNASVAKLNQWKYREKCVRANTETRG